MTVAVVLPAKFNRAEINAKVTKWYEYHRERSTRGERKISRKDTIIPSRKKPNIRFETTWIRVRIVVTFEGSAMVAP